MTTQWTTIPPHRMRDTLDITAPATAGMRDRVRDPRPTAGVTGLWVLESWLGDEGLLQRTPLHPLPFRIGRAAGLQLVLPSAHVSKVHAEIYSDGLAIRVRDLGSRNGTLLNREPVQDAPLHEGDMLRFGEFEFRVSRDNPELQDGGGELSFDRTVPLSQHLISGVTKIRQLIDQGTVDVLYQPLVALSSGRAVAYEALGRGRMPGLPESPAELFDVVGVLGGAAQAELARLFRRKAVELVRDRPEPPTLFLNTHPVELEMPGLLESLEELRGLAPRLDLVLEIHESALAESDFIGWLRGRLAEINVALAYDDFGAGQARLFELAEAPPHYLKFDRRFVTGLDRAPVSRQRLVTSLVAAARELQVSTVAEGVETAEEAAACRQAGFSHAQGYYLGLPAPVDDLP